ncbi:MAG TPA: PEP-CTERM sorting domain-containing protein [Candidatus Binatia bacterium]|nr:PEP-CTERM sorting domain-containing protein [Candidatus Binatia bacterium]
MRRLLLASAIVICICAAVSAYADPIEFKLLGFVGGDWQNGYPYYIQPVNAPVFKIDAVMCDDWFHGGTIGQDWQANITQLGTDNISLTRFNLIPTSSALGPLTLYDEAGWILMQTQSQPFSEWKFMNYAVWHILDSDAPLLGDAASWITAAEQEAAQHFPGVDFNRIYIITPVNQYDPDPHGPQEFLYLGQDNMGPAGPWGPGQSTPEPGTLLLLGTGVVGIVGRKLWR